MKTRPGHPVLRLVNDRVDISPAARSAGNSASAPPAGGRGQDPQQIYHPSQTPASPASIGRTRATEAERPGDAHGPRMQVHLVDDDATAPAAPLPTPTPVPRRSGTVQFGALAAMNDARARGRAGSSGGSGRTAKDAARSAVAMENVLASKMSADDARWILAVKVGQLMEGGTSAFLSGERRRSVMASARSLGLREFDASLIIAIVQDNARAGRAAMDERVRSRLALVGMSTDADSGDPRDALGESDDDGAIALGRPGAAKPPERTVDWPGVRWLAMALLLGAVWAWMLASWVSSTPTHAAGW
jgi:hypothetical protein